MNIIICRANEVLDIIAERGNVDAVLSIEHPGATDGKGRAPRLEDVDQQILCFWDIEEENIQDGPAERHIEAAFNFLKEHVGDNVIIHCNAGKARSAGIALAWKMSEYQDIQKAVEEIKDVRPIAAPNLAVVKIADRFLNLEGELTDAVLKDPLFTENRIKAEERRQEQMRGGQFSDLSPEKHGPEPV